MTPVERAYVKTVQQAFRLIQREEEGTTNPMAARVVVRELDRLEAQLGPDRCRVLHQKEATVWRASTKRNPWTGRLDPPAA